MFIAGAFLLWTLCINAQTDSVGIYPTTNDYQLKKLKYAAPCQNKKHGLRLNKFLDQSFVTVFENGKKRHVEKSAVFGFHDCESKDYRFFKNHEYAIIRYSGTLHLYSREMLQPKGKTVVAETFYFFSNGIDGVILPLTINDLRFAFPDNWRFHELIEKQFPDEKSLMHYDTARQEYELITTYNHSKNYY
jgi:hypothetical protein